LNLAVKELSVAVLFRVRQMVRVIFIFFSYYTCNDEIKGQKLKKERKEEKKKEK